VQTKNYRMACILLFFPMFGRGIIFVVNFRPNRTLLTAIICQTILLLIFLGARPVIPGSTFTPKPSYRAVVDSADKSVQEDCGKLQIDYEHCLQNSVPTFEALFVGIIHQHYINWYAPSTTLPSRAPPRFTALFS